MTVREALPQIAVRAGNPLLKDPLAVALPMGQRVVLITEDRALHAAYPMLGGRGGLAAEDCPEHTRRAAAALCRVFDYPRLVCDCINTGSAVMVHDVLPLDELEAGRCLLPAGQRHDMVRGTLIAQPDAVTDLNGLLMPRYGNPLSADYGYTAAGGWLWKGAASGYLPTATWVWMPHHPTGLE